jgi:isopentenyl phosphate kinase
MTRLIFLKLGGSVITDKDRTNTPNLERINAIAKAIKKALDQDPSLSILIGHGSGSFGHHAAKKFDTRDGVFTKEDWLGFTEVALRARELNQIVLGQLLQTGLPAVSISPFSEVFAENRHINFWNTTFISDCLIHHLVPVIYGDVILDSSIGGTILSTEELFAFLAPVLKPEQILLAGLEKGVWMDFPLKTQLISEIHPDDFAHLQSELKGSGSLDVTGGMFSKVQTMISIINQIPSLEVQIFSGQSPDNVYSTLMGDRIGTTIRNLKG